jgi:hypothetical protein
MTTAYRNLDRVVLEQLGAYHARQAEQRDAIDAARDVLASRTGYAVAGGAATALGILMFLVAFTPWRNVATAIMGGGWLAGLLLVFVARDRVLTRTASALWRGPALTGNPHADLVYLQNHDPLEELRAHARRWEHASAALPITSLVLLTPMTLHWVVKAAADAGEGRGAASQGFATWIAAGALYFGLAHIALAGHAFVWTRSLVHRPAAAVCHGVHGAWMKALALAVIAAFVPVVFSDTATPMGAFFEFGPSMLVPPALVTATGLAFVPHMYWLSARRIHAERQRLGD